MRVKHRDLDRNSPKRTFLIVINTALPENKGEKAPDHHEIPAEEIVATAALHRSRYFRKRLG